MSWKLEILRSVRKPFVWRRTRSGNFAAVLLAQQGSLIIGAGGHIALSRAVLGSAGKLSVLLGQYLRYIYDGFAMCGGEVSLRV